jgi:hypothetical protein
MMKSKRMRCSMYGKKGNAYRVLTGKAKEN